MLAAELAAVQPADRGGASRRDAVRDRLLLRTRRLSARGFRDPARRPPRCAARGRAHRRSGARSRPRWHAWRPRQRRRFELCARDAARACAASTRAATGDTARRRRVLFLSDSPTPVRFAPMNRIARRRSRAWRSRRAARSSPASRSIRSGSERRRNRGLRARARADRGRHGRHLPRRARSRDAVLPDARGARRERSESPVALHDLARAVV